MWQHRIQVNSASANTHEQQAHAENHQRGDEEAHGEGGEEGSGGVWR